jgi:arylsulfatase A-like enzyme/Tfp pilus assembly protein PilF
LKDTEAMKKRPQAGMSARGDTRRKSPRRWGAAALALVLLAVAAAAGWWIRSSRTVSGARSAGIILVTIDTLRWDAVGYAGSGGAETPFLDRLAREGRHFSNAHAHNVVTLPSHANILTGLLPYQHGIRDNSGFTLAESHTTIATRLKEKGWATGAFVGAFPLDARYGLNRGFDVYDDEYREGSAPLSFAVAERRADEVLEAAVTWWNQNQGQKRFLWVHLFDPHAPYAPPSPFRERYAEKPYLGEVAWTDHELARWLGPIVARDPQPAIIVTSDHGEALGDHGEHTHGLFAYEATLKVPLLIRAPGIVGAGEETRYVRHIDLVPTILELAGLGQVPELPGTSLLAVDGDRDTYFEALSTSLNRGWAPLVGMIHQRSKYIELPLPELYDLPADPGEKINLYPEERRTITAIRKILAESAPRREVAGRNVSSEESAKLLSLGYISGDAAKKSYTEADDPKNLVEVDGMIHRAVDAYQRGELDEAIASASTAVKARPDMEAGQEMLAFLLQQKEQPEAAIATLRESVERGTASDVIRTRYALMLSEEGRPEEAVRVLEPIAAKNDPDVLNAYGVALADSGRLAEAKNVLERVLTVDRTNAKALQNLGVVAMRAGNRAAAKQYLDRALALNDRLPLALNMVGVIAAQEGDTAGAIEAWKRSVALDPRQYDALFNLGMVAGRSGRAAEARAALEQFAATAPPERYGKDILQARAILGRL